MLTEQRLHKMRHVAAHRQDGLIVVLEDIYDPHNAEAVFRTCDAFGVQQVYLIFEKQKPFNPKKIGKSSSSSANKWLDFKRFTSTAVCMAELKQLGFTCAATALDTDSKSLFEIQFNHPRLALLFGNEHRGLSETAKAASDFKLMIPMNGMVQSLNLSVTAALCIYEVTRQRWRAPRVLPESAQTDLVESFVQRSLR